MHAGVPTAFLTVFAVTAGLGSAAPETCCSDSPEGQPAPRTLPSGPEPPAAGPAASRPAAFMALTVNRPVGLRARPRGPVTSWLAPETEFGSPRVVGVVSRRGAWLGVTTPTLPDGQLGWIRRGDPAVNAGRVRWSLRADLSERRLVLRRGAKVVRRLTVAIGAAGSPTPTGRFAVTDKLAGGRYSAAYGCCILALSGHQPNLPAGWRGGNRLAIHGTYGEVGLPATAGCLRASNDEMAELMRRVPLGTPVFIGR